MLPTLDLPPKSKFMFDLLSIYEMKEDIANNTAAIAELHPETTSTTTISSTAHPKDLLKDKKIPKTIKKINKALSQNHLFTSLAW